jgi:hypothetical protein
MVNALAVGARSPLRSLRSVLVAAVLGAPVLLAGGAATALGARPGAALVEGARSTTEQVLVGTVVDLETRQPIAGAMVTLLTESNRQVEDAVRSDSAGTFTITTTHTGRFRLKAVRIGYMASRNPSFPLKSGERLTFQLEMSASSQILAPLTILARDRGFSGIAFRSPLDAFEYRRTKGAGGVFFTTDQIVNSGALDVAQLIQMRAGATILFVRDTFGTRTETVMLRRAAFGPQVGNACPVVFYLDGFRLQVDVAIAEHGGLIFPVPRALGTIVMSDVYGVEVYRSSTEMPGEFASTRNVDGSGSECGVVAVWTKRGRAPSSEPPPPTAAAGPGSAQAQGPATPPAKPPPFLSPSAVPA